MTDHEQPISVEDMRERIHNAGSATQYFEDKGFRLGAHSIGCGPVLWQALFWETLKRVKELEAEVERLSRHPTR